jgi:hypothetical protein
MWIWRWSGGGIREDIRSFQGYAGLSVVLDIIYVSSWPSHHTLCPAPGPILHQPSGLVLWFVADFSQRWRSLAGDRGRRARSDCLLLGSINSKVSLRWPFPHSFLGSCNQSVLWPLLWQTLGSAQSLVDYLHTADAFIECPDENQSAHHLLHLWT